MSVESIKQAVGAAIQRASEATGADFGYLMRTAARESGYDPRAQASGSSAAGLFQFIDQTWLGALKRHGAKHGYGDYAELIKGGEGRWSVADPHTRRAVMGLRLDPRAASLMAGELASDNAAYLRGRVGREPTAGELYAAHFLGPKGAAELIDAAQLRPGAAAASLFPEAAAANPSIFYREGRPASAAEVYGALTKGQPAAPSETAPSQAAPAFLHHNLEARLARIEQERALSNLILGLEPEGADLGFRDGGGRSRGAAGSLFTAEMLTLLSQARQGDGRG